jgi:hypothetical protein
MDAFLHESQSVIRQIFLEAKNEGLCLVGYVWSGV